MSDGPDVPYLPAGMPLPVGDRQTEEFWEGCRRRRLLVQRCSACGTHRHTPRPLCASCGSFEFEWDESAGRGSVFTYTVVHHSVHPATNDSVPYNVAVIRLDDCSNVLVTSNVVGCPLDALHVGMAVELVWEQVADDVNLYRFRPAGGS